MQASERCSKVLQSVESILQEVDDVSDFSDDEDALNLANDVDRLVESLEQGHMSPNHGVKDVDQSFMFSPQHPMDAEIRDLTLAKQDLKEENSRLKAVIQEMSHALRDAEAELRRTDAVRAKMMGLAVKVQKQQHAAEHLVEGLIDQRIETPPSMPSTPMTPNTF